MSRWNTYLPHDLLEQYIYTAVKIESPRMKKIKYLCETENKDINFKARRLGNYALYLVN